MEVGLRRNIDIDIDIDILCKNLEWKNLLYTSRFALTR